MIADGIGLPEGLPRYPSFLSGMFHFVGPRLLSRTGEQFFAVDKWSLHGRPLLEVMADPRKFQHTDKLTHL
jgi:hypothetical protein